MKLNAIRNIFLVLALTFPVLFSSSRADAYAFLHECAPTWSKMPVRYKINQHGSQNFPDIKKLESILHASFEAWEEPCCSNFVSQYDGLTSLTADQNQGQVVLSFADSQFPPEYGGAETIAVTLLYFHRNCTIQQAPILFNGANHSFRSDGRNVDLQSVATHEVGHLLGLDHSHINRATMYYAYTGGTSARNLHDDDIQGVCALYPRVCSCSQDSECPGDEQCISGQCEKVPCTADSQCADEMVCQDGDCIVPPCHSDAECGPGFQCTDEKCVSVCPSCRTCEGQGDCGGNGHCVDYGDGIPKCMVLCSQGGMCPGDSECFQLPMQEQTLYVCLNSDAQHSGMCPDSYTCQDKPKETDPGKTDPNNPGNTDPNNPGNTDPNNPGNTDPNNPGSGNNTGNGPGNGGNGNAGSNQDDDEIIIVTEETGRQSSCSAVPVNDASSPTGALAILLAGGLFVNRVRRRRRNH